MIRRARLRALLLGLVLAAASPSRSLAVNACADGGRSRPDEGGIGGTGARSGGDDGIGGTGARPDATDDSGIGGTGVREDSGIGGTGRRADSGIGGTGIGAETGIIGTITGFGSICVGGIEIRYDAETPVRVDGETARAVDLQIGQVVEVVARGTGEDVDAREIAVRHIVSGPVTELDAERNQISVAGQTVQLPESGAISAKSFSVDASVQVSGMRRSDGVIVATRVAAADSGDDVRLSGTLSRLATGALAIDGTEIRTASSVRSDVGEDVRVAGRWVAGAIQVEKFEPLPTLPFDGRVAHLELEGYVRQSARGEVRLGNYAIESSSQAFEKGATAETRVRVEAQVRGSRVVVERVEVMRDFPNGAPRPDDGRGWRKGPDDRGPRSDGPQAGPADDANPHFVGGDPAHRPEPRDADAPGRMDRPAEGEAHGHPEMPPPADRPDMLAPPDRPDHGGRPDRPDRLDMPPADRPARPDLPPPPPDRPERPAPPPDRPERPDRPAPRPDRAGPPDLPPRVDRPDLPRRN